MPEINFSQQEAALPANPVADAPFRALNPEARQVMLRQSTSRSQRKIQEDVETTRRQLEATGMLKPATVINFNPVPLVLDGLIRMTVPQRGFSKTGEVVFEHGGRDYVGHAMTIHSPLIYAATSGWEQDPDTLSDMPQLSAHYILPIGIAYAYLEHYSLNAKDSAHMGGVLIFEGDRHTLSPSHLERSGGNIQMPEPILLPRNRRSYTTKECSLDDVISECFSTQAIYADFRIQNAHSLWTTNDPMQQKQITDVDRLWARYALEHGMIEDLPEWVRARVLSGSALASVVRCPVCAKPRPFQNIYVCPDDRAPYNTFEAVMAGMPVAQQWIDALPDEQLALVSAEMVRREGRSKAAMDKAKRDAKAAAKAGDEEN